LGHFNQPNTEAIIKKAWLRSGQVRASACGVLALMQIGMLMTIGHQLAWRLWYAAAISSFVGPREQGGL
jgi:hypothetical protein